MKRKFILLLIGCFIFSVHGFAQKSAAKKTAEIPYGDNSSAGKYAPINGIKLYYEIYGKGQPLLMLHGNGGSIKAFEKQIPFFEKHFMVIAVDSRLQGKSGGSPDSLSYDMMADDFCALLDYLKIDSAFVLGWSDGGINAVIMAMHCPQKVKGLAITGTNIVPDTTAFDISVIQDMKDFVQQKNISPVDRTLNNMMINQPNIPYSDLKKIHCPVLVMAGDHDLIKPEHTLKIYQSLPNAELCIFPDSEHGVCQQHPELFNSTVFTFFQKYISKK